MTSIYWPPRPQAYVPTSVVITMDDKTISYDCYGNRCAEWHRPLSQEESWEYLHNPYCMFENNMSQPGASR